MSFREKSAWVMAVLMSVAGLYYLTLVLKAAPADGLAAPEALAPYAMLVVVGSIVVQAILGAIMPKEANAPADERERPLIDRAGNWSGYVLAAGALGGLWNYLVRGDGDLMFQIVLGGLIAAQIAEYVFQIVLFRRSA